MDEPVLLRYQKLNKEPGSKKYMIVFWVLIISVFLLLLWVIVVYNALVALRNEVKNAWKQIDVQLKRRHDLIPSLVSVVKGYMQHERETFEKVTLARSKALSATGVHDKALAEHSLTQALHGFFAVIENYPVLRSNENALHLQEELTTTENRIAFSRQLYNDLAANLATSIEVFPNNIVASLFSFGKAEYFTADESDRRLPSAEIGIKRG
jgi:LemA protein